MPVSKIQCKTQKQFVEIFEDITSTWTCKQRSYWLLRQIIIKNSFDNKGFWLSEFYADEYPSVDSDYLFNTVYYGVLTHWVLSHQPVIGGPSKKYYDSFMELLGIVIIKGNFTHTCDPKDDDMIDACGISYDPYDFIAYARTSSCCSSIKIHTLREMSAGIIHKLVKDGFELLYPFPDSDSISYPQPATKDNCSSPSICGPTSTQQTFPPLEYGDVDYLLETALDDYHAHHPSITDFEMKNLSLRSYGEWAQKKTSGDALTQVTAKELVYKLAFILYPNIPYVQSQSDHSPWIPLVILGAVGVIALIWWMSKK